MKPSPRRVMALWRNNPGWQSSLTGIRQAMGSKKSELPKLRALLEDLVDQGKLTYEKHRFRLTQKPPEAPVAPSVPRTRTEEFTGRFAAHPDGFGFVEGPELPQSLFIPPRKIGGALHGDTVRVRLVRPRAGDRVSGSISEVLERGRKRLRGFVHKEKGETWLMPLNEKLPMVFLESAAEGGSHPPGTFVEAEFTAYPPDMHTAPVARALRALEKPETPEQILDYVLADLQIEVAFSKQTMREMSALAKQPAHSAGEGREDLTAQPFVTIDGEDARDFDDAVCLERTGQGGYRLLVAIADVAEFVRPESAVDRDAYARGTSVYFPERVVPMLPELLSNDLCSLKPGLPRLTLVCEMELSATGERTGYRLYEGLIRSKARLTYEQVQRFLTSHRRTHLKQAAPHGPMLRDMLGLSELLAGKRKARGALAFEFPEARFVFAAPGQPTEILRALPTQATRMIEQFMLEANETVAWHCQGQRIPILYRAHDPPPADQLAELRLLLHNFGVETRERELSEPAGINRLLESIASHPQHAVMELAVLRTMAQAQYRPSNDGHFGLNATHYTHFTSPIRRYPDLLAHRALKRSFATGKRRQSKGAALPGDAGMLLSARERTAAEAENRINRLYRVIYMEKFVGEEFSAEVTGLSRRGLFVALRAHYVEGLLPIDLLPRDQYRFDARSQVLRATRTRRMIGLGERLTVQLARAERITQQIEFAFVDWGWGEAKDGR
ncbi:MAG: ribonuclease R [SAR324 cluster bacterium]|nr:ribonuclease R [SAR324 cluster bacterium]